MFKQAHKRQMADKDGAWDSRGIPNHVMGLLRAQVLSCPAFAACLCLGVHLGLVTEVDARQISVSVRSA